MKKKMTNSFESDNSEEYDLEQCLELAKYVADKYFGGHYTIYSFTFGYKFMMGTVTDRDEIQEADTYEELIDAVINGTAEAVLEVGKDLGLNSGNLEMLEKLV
jgi:hypothetical protein